MDKFSYISNAHPDYIESLYNDFKSDPASVDEEFRKFFEGFEFASTNFSENGSAGVSVDEFKVYHLIQSYRNKGHLLAKTNPIKERKDRFANLNIEAFGLKESDLKKDFVAGNEIGIGKATLERIIDHLDKCYSKTLGFEYSYLKNPEEIQWFRKQIENNPALVEFEIEKKERVLRKLNQAVVFEKFLGTKYIGEKRFSLEGGETTIPALDTIINKCADNGAEEFTIGMAHRGRLNVLANIIGKTYEEIFNEFEGNTTQDPNDGDGDVKYHLGYSSLFKTDNGKEVYLRLAPNPSHLEAVDPVVLGFSRARVEQHFSDDFTKVVPILIHGDAAIAGQGVVYEVLQMRDLDAYTTGGVIHFVINNQIGFTTDFEDARSSDYCTSLASATLSPVIHVNGDDIEAAVFAAEMAAEYRQKFGKDIFVDMVCYRKHGHNEGDDPKYTQPGMYKLISKHPNPRDVYIKKLESAGDSEAKIAQKLDQEFWEELQNKLDQVKEDKIDFKRQPPESDWKKVKKSESGDLDKSYDTSITRNMAKTIIRGLTVLPDDFKPLRKIDKMLKNRREVMEKNKSIDWPAAELMAYGSLLLDGHNVRMSGQDVERGTFSSRHAIIYNEETGEKYNRLNHMDKDQGEFKIYNSHLSEYGVLGFEYGYSLSSPQALTVWEAQFGDFANNAHVIIDQFITSGESKWQKNTGLVMLLPHGYEGQGPEHSSARLERYLQSSAEDNIVVMNISEPANLFHALRRQLVWPFRKPLIIMSPKSLLRHERCVSSIDLLFKGGVREIIDDENIADPKKVRKILFCTGKVYYDLLERKEKDDAKDIAIVRIEQLYPLSESRVEKIVKKYPNASHHWVQEESKNMGAWQYMLDKFYNHKSIKLECISRNSSASPATGFKKLHLKEQEDILNRAFK